MHEVLAAPELFDVFFHIELNFFAVVVQGEDDFLTLETVHVCGIAGIPVVQVDEGRVGHV